MLLDARKARDQREDWYSARIVAMLVAVNGKRGKYEPMKWMLNGRDMQRERAERVKRREGMTGEEVMARFAALGVPIIDKRAKV